MTIKATMQRLAAGTGALALAMAGAVAMGTAASAVQQDDGVAPGNAPTDATGTLVIHKYAGTGTDDDNDGTEQTIDRPALAGVVFGICLVDDLSEDGAWEGVANLNVADAVCDETVTSSAATDINGETSFEGLAIGLYKVTEVSYPDGVTPGADFLVTIPFPSAGSDDTWLWTVHAYPKNTIESDATKEVDDSEAVVEGDDVSWTVTSPVLAVAPGSTIPSFILTDELAEQLEYVDGSLVATLVDGPTETTLVFDVTYDPAGFGGTLTATASDSALAALNAASSAAYVVFTFDTEVGGPGLIENTAVVNIGSAEFETNPVDTPWGFAQLTKYEAGTENTLDGAVFDVYVAGENGVCPATPQGNAVVTDLETVNGELETPALKADDYCFHETKAPAGYTLPTGAAAWTAFTVEAGEIASASVAVDNVPTEGPDLPLTGAQGTLAMTIGGLLLVGVGAGAIVVSRRRRNA